MTRDMTQALKVAPPPPSLMPGGAVIRHNQAEDFTIYQPAGFVLRWYALTLDVLFCAPLDVLIHMPFTRYLERLEAYGFEGRAHLVTVLLTAIPVLLYFIAPTALYGQTLGKKIVGIRVVRRDFGADLPMAAVIFRETGGKILSVFSLGIGFAMAGVTERKRALHDVLAHTQVLSYRQR